MTWSGVAAPLMECKRYQAASMASNLGCTACVPPDTKSILEYWLTTELLAIRSHAPLAGQAHCSCALIVLIVWFIVKSTTEPVLLDEFRQQCGTSACNLMHNDASFSLESRPVRQDETAGLLARLHEHCMIGQGSHKSRPINLTVTDQWTRTLQLLCAACAGCIHEAAGPRIPPAAASHMPPPPS